MCWSNMLEVTCVGGDMLEVTCVGGDMCWR